jgi:glutamyl-tRNA synthetase
MGVTEVVRGDDLVPSTPRQILLFRLMGAAPPLYAHLPLLCDASGERLAKRHQGLEIAALRRNGIRPEAIIGYLGYLAGWQTRARPAEPSDLLSGFSLVTLMGRRMRLPPEPLRVIAAV